MRPLPNPHLHEWRKIELCLINFNKGEDDEGCLKFCNILKWSAKCIRKATEGLFIKYSTLWQHKCESLTIVFFTGERKICSITCDFFVLGFWLDLRKVMAQTFSNTFFNCNLLLTIVYFKWKTVSFQYFVFFKRHRYE